MNMKRSHESSQPQKNLKKPGLNQSEKWNNLNLKRKERENRRQLKLQSKSQRESRKNLISVMMIRPDKEQSLIENHLRNHLESQI